MNDLETMSYDLETMSYDLFTMSIELEYYAGFNTRLRELSEQLRDIADELYLERIRKENNDNN